MTHQMLLNSVPRSVASTEHDNRKKPNISGPKAPPDESKARRVRRPETTPAITPSPINATAVQNSLE